MYCSNCGKELNDGVKFCPECGASVMENDPSKRKQVFEGKVYKCPNCGELLKTFEAVCPSCGMEIRDKKIDESISEFLNKVQAEPNEEKKIELIKLYPIPNTREGIFEFMLLATSKFDVGFYASNPKANSIASAWLSQIELCYKKGKMMLTDSSDLARLDQLYNDIHGKDGTLTKARKKRLIITIVGVSCIVIGAIVMFIIAGANDPDVAGSAENNSSGWIMVPTLILAGGIVTLAVGLKKQKTNKELEIERERREAKERAKKNRR